MKKHIINIWVHNLEIKIAFPDGDLFTQKYKTKAEMELGYAKAMAFCQSLGKEIKINENN